MQAIFRPRLSETSVALNGWFRGIPETTIEPQLVDYYWRYDDEPDMVPQYLASVVPGDTLSAPFPGLTRAIRLIKIPRAGTGAEAPQNFAEAEQTVFTPSSPEAAGARGGPLFDHHTNVTTIIGAATSETLWIDNIPAGLMSSDGDKIVGKSSGFVGVGPGNNSFIGIDLGGVSFITDALNHADTHWHLVYDLMRDDNETLLMSGVFTIGGVVHKESTERFTGFDFDNVGYEFTKYAITEDAGDVTAMMDYAEFVPSANTLVPGDPITFLGEIWTFHGEPITFTP